MSEAEAVGRPFVAGMYGYYRGGRAHSAADRAALENPKAVVPEIDDAAGADLGFPCRPVIEADLQDADGIPAGLLMVADK